MHRLLKPVPQQGIWHHQSCLIKQIIFFLEKNTQEFSSVCKLCNHNVAHWPIMWMLLAFLLGVLVLCWISGSYFFGWTLAANVNSDDNSKSFVCHFAIGKTIKQGAGLCTNHSHRENCSFYTSCQTCLNTWFCSQVGTSGKFFLSKRKCAFLNGMHLKCSNNRHQVTLTWQHFSQHQPIGVISEVSSKQ